MPYSKIIAGTMTWGSWGKQLTKNTMVELMHHCIEQQITTFDHADIYGAYTTEADFGQAFKDSGIRREHIQLISKCGIQYLSNNRKNTVKHYDYSKDYIIWSVDTSLQNLKTDYLDLLLLHRPSPLMDPEEIAEAVSILKSSGKIRDFGVSNFTSSQMELVSKHHKIDVNQIEFSLTSHQGMHDGTLDYMMVNNIKPMAWSPLGSVFKNNDEQVDRIQQELNRLCEKYGATKDQLLLNWILRHPSNISPVIGTTNKERIANAGKAGNIDLELEDWFKLLVASQGHKVP
ncbi:aldo/keto reductase [Hanstruepera neustonica]|uniref:Aldo/keto reductase n=1 Tax=Hanstruepera neustonica TaxID=1445657 RepID=A0A2K1E3N2_9FLAO|nr:aldo/keto reductase [Hanstruepera neustonica]PNQ74896.1 aldo/keto reductase [Hanstruepera neustonica]